MPSKLVKILGAYRVNCKNLTSGKVRTEWLLIFDNLAATMPVDSVIYDLKGTTNIRRKVQKKGMTMMDVNFIEDFNTKPIALRSETKRLLDACI